MALNTARYDALLKAWPTGRGHKGSKGFTQTLADRIGYSQRAVLYARGGGGGETLVKLMNEEMKIIAREMREKARGEK